MHQSQIFFNQDCPVCGRKMRVRIELLGKEIGCGHCSAVTVAYDDTDHGWAGLGHSKKVQRLPLRQLQAAGR
jgi:hypothetical protein